VKQLICDAFCTSLEFRQVPAGYAVSTPYENSDGDPLLIYFIRDERQRWRLEDDGTQIPLLEANGVALGSGARAEAFASLLDEYGAFYNKDSCTLFSPPMLEAELGTASVRFLGLLLRLQDLALMLNPATVRNTFKADAIAALHRSFDGIAEVIEQSEFSPELSGHDVDVVIRAHEKPPVAIYFGTQEERALQALVLKMEAEKYRNIAGSVILMLERAKENPIKGATLSLAMARLDAVVSFRESELDTMQRISRIAGLNSHVGLMQ
jgi:hypothetical protein